MQQLRNIVYNIAKLQFTTIVKSQFFPVMYCMCNTNDSVIVYEYMYCMCNTNDSVIVYVLYVQYQ